MSIFGAVLLNLLFMQKNRPKPSPCPAAVKSLLIRSIFKNYYLETYGAMLG